MSPSPSSTIMTDGSDDMQDMVFAKRGCCFWIPCMGSTSSTPTAGLWERMRAPEDKERSWWSRGWKRIREWSEVVSGPKWRMFFRRFKRNRRVAAYNKRGSFRYDPLSYALNFDNDDSADTYTGFSSRFASLPPSAKSSMDLGKDSPSFT